MKLAINLGGWRLKAELVARRLPYIPVAGISSRCVDRKHVLFLEYDNIVRWLVEDELEWLTVKYGLTPFYLFRSSLKKMKWNDDEEYGNYHAISLTKLSPADIMEIQSHTHIDYRYRMNFNVNLYKCNVLRMSGKGDKPQPVFLKTLGCMTAAARRRKTSTAHRELLEGQYKSLNRIKYHNEDGSHRPVLVSYLTAHK
jgi:hypothetical protein